MGYYTTYEFEVIGANEDDVIATIKDQSKYEDFDQVKWYNHEKDMIEVSKKFPAATIQVDGVGEEYPDIWRKWFRNGDMAFSKAVITFNKPDW